MNAYSAIAEAMAANKSKSSKASSGSGVTEDASKRQATLNALNGVYTHDGENVR